jgi:hypothetical protein
MYKQINIVGDLIQNAKEFVLNNDRMLYAPFFTIVEKYCASTCIIGGRVGAELLIGIPINKDSFMWELYTNDTYKTARDISTEFLQAHSPHINAATTNYKTDIRNIEQSISVNGRTLIKIYRADKYRNLDLMKMIRPITVKGYFGNDVQCLSEELQLCEVYQVLYSPSKFDKWGFNLSLENLLYTHVEPQLVDIFTTTGINNTSGSGDSGSGDSGSSGSNDILSGFSDRDAAVIENLNGIYIGGAAMKILGMKTTITRLQIICDKSINEIIDILKVILASTCTKQTQITLSAVEYKLNLVSDFRLTKHTIYIVKSSTDRIPFIDVFNSSQYELIPIIRKKYKRSLTTLNADNNEILIGNLYVLLRFKMIDAWAVKLILGITPSANIKKSVECIISDIKLLRSEIISKLQSSPGYLFPLNDYIGTFVSERISKKKLIEDAGETFRPCYPVMNA